MIVDSLYIGFVPEIMSLKEAGENQTVMLQGASDSSEGETYDDISYGSDVQPPDIAPGFVMVHKNCYREKYHTSRVA